MSLPLSPSAADPLLLPRRPGEQRGASFPLIASVAPLVASVILFALTRSAFALVFAGLSPLIAVAGYLDGRRSTKRRRRTDATAYDAARRRFLGEVEERHGALRAALLARYPRIVRVIDERSLWSLERLVGARIVLGNGDVASELAVSGAVESDDDRELRQAAGVLSHAPVLAPALGTLGIIGPRILRNALARGYLTRLVHTLSPRAVECVAPVGGEWQWLSVLPHFRHRPENIRGLCESVTLSERARPGQSTQEASFTIALAPRIDDLPPGCDTIVEIAGTHRAHILVAPVDSIANESVEIELVTATEAHRLSLSLSDRASRTGFVRDDGALPSRVLFGDVAPAHTPGAGGSSLGAAIGVTASGTATIDLVRSGPHAIVAGTTGSGKSELLQTWVLSMARERSPRAVNFLLVDFKGGSAFAPLARLPHTVGLITDLGHGEALRALQSLRAELRRRERILAEAHARDISSLDNGTLPRLVVVVDEFAAMLESFAELADLFTDIAARGRSLGVHLILCTQRVSGVIRDSVLANCALRLSLRVTNASDSAAVVGTDAAWRLPPTLAGRCVVLSDGESVLTQVAASSAGDLDAILERCASAPAPAPFRPWLDPLGTRITVDELDPDRMGDSLALGVLDEPSEQRQSVASFSPIHQNLVAIGARGSGKSNLISALGYQWPSEWIGIGSDVEAAWDALQSVVARLRSAESTGTVAVLVTIDDLDALIDRFEGEYRDAVCECVREIAVDGPRRGVHLVCTASRVSGALRPLVSLMDATLHFRAANRQEHLLAGLPSDMFDDLAPAGRAVWQGASLQVAFADVARPRFGDGEVGVRARAVTERLSFPAGTITVMVSRTAVRRHEALLAQGIEAILVGAGGVVSSSGGSSTGAARAEGSEPGTRNIGSVLDIVAGAAEAGAASAIVIVGDPDAWQSQWSLFATLRPGARIVFDGCSLAEIRALLRQRVLPPILAAGSDRVIVAQPAGDLSRAVIA